MTSNFVNKIFKISRLITKFTKILCHENLELYGIYLWHTVEGHSATGVMVRGTLLNS